ncbi:hypothetical protein BC828DRAFT_439079 [Blastocladiella britannica]|nr:hypothetical protein BC828DRAFT_439079 [Blastocladiella britannica]
MYDLGSAGQLELLRLLDSPCRTGTLAAFADAAATAGHAHVLAWLLSVSLTLLQLSEQGHPVDSPLQNIVRNTIVYGRMRVLDWCAAHGADIRTELLFSVASHHSQRHSLGWLKAHSIKHGLDYAFETPARNFLPVTADRLVAMLDWWKAEYTARPEPLFLAYAEFRPEYAWFAEDGLRVVDWWHDYCSEVGHEFTWPAFTTTTLCVFTDTGGSARFNDWFWDLSTGSEKGAGPLRHWRPRYPFFRLDEIQWWEAKIESGHAGFGVFDLPLAGSPSKLDTLFRRPSNGEYLDRCTPESPLPLLTFETLASLVSQSRMDLAMQILQLSVAYNKPLTLKMNAREIDVCKFHTKLPATAVLDYLWGFCARIGVRFELCYNPQSALLAARADELVSPKWWHAMHHAHGTAFPSAEELADLECE